MSRFYVGQRVRIVWAGLSKGLIGTETTIKAIGVPAYSSLLGDYVGIETSAINAVGNTFVALPVWLEPATDSYDVTTWDTCVWKPEHLRVEA